MPKWQNPPGCPLLFLSGIFLQWSWPIARWLSNALEGESGRAGEQEKEKEKETDSSEEGRERESERVRARERESAARANSLSIVGAE
mmetsp:Transcript_54066/g.79261  ORF Transcript_54066/g.79261 Transcript_54066/m.79261 type:complete len:87 (-) Transcript_54066:704-964(-)